MAVGDDALRAELECYGVTLRRLERALPAARVMVLLEYLTRHPLGAHNRQVAEQLERALEQLPYTGLRSGLTGRYRALREPLLPPLSRGGQD